jgi:surface antigen
MSYVDDLLQETSSSVGEVPTTGYTPQVKSGQSVFSQPLQETQADMVARQSSHRLLAVPSPDITRILNGMPSQSTTTALRVPIAIKAGRKRIAPLAPYFQSRDRRIFGLLVPVLLLLITGGVLLAASPLDRNASSGQSLGLHQKQQGNTLIQSTGSNIDNLEAHATSTPLPRQLLADKSSTSSNSSSGSSSASASNGSSGSSSASASNGSSASDAATNSYSLDWPVGQCTYWANERYHELSGYWVSWHGDAGEWVSGASQANWQVSTTPHIPSIIVLLPGVEGASSEYGHVAVAEKMLNNTTVEASTMNWFANGGGFDIQSSWDYTAGSGVYFVWH